jgi:hypothetical protein
MEGRGGVGISTWSEYAWDTVNTEVKIFTQTYSLFPRRYILVFINILIYILIIFSFAGTVRSVK